MTSPTVEAASRRDSSPHLRAAKDRGIKPLLQKALPWLLLSASLAANIHLWPRASDHNSYRSHPTHKPYSETSAISAHPASTALPPSPTPTPPSLNSQPSTLSSTASRSSAFRGYADVLAEDLKTPEQLSSLNDLLARWVATDPPAAAAWLGQHDDTPIYDPAALHVAKHLVARQQFTEATAWTDLIRTPALQEEARDAIIAESFRAKKIDATAVRLSGLPPPRIESILNGSRLY